MTDSMLEIIVTLILLSLAGAALVMIAEAMAFATQGRLREAVATLAIAMGYGTLVLRVGDVIFDHSFTPTPWLGFTPIPWTSLIAFALLGIGTVTLGYFSINRRRRDKLAGMYHRRRTDRQPWED